MVLDPDESLLAAARTVLAVASAGGDHRPLSEDWSFLGEAEARGYFTPPEDAVLRTRYARYLSSREALARVLEMLEPICGRNPACWREQLPALAITLAAAAMLANGSRATIALAETSRLLRKKLDEPEPSYGIPANTFARLYRSGTAPRRLARLYEALTWWRENRGEFGPIGQVAEYGAILELLDNSETRIEISGHLLLRDRLRYRWFSFRRRNHSAWKKSVFELFRFSGSIIADLHQPGIKPPGQPKRMSAELRLAVLKHARPGDIFITRHDDALSNLFLPGFWPHAALFLGADGEHPETSYFLEAKKDGVRRRPAEETLGVDAMVILRPPLELTRIQEAIARGLTHEGKLYDFTFDFRTSHRLACTELIYRSYHQCGPIEFQLREVGGRLCLTAEELISQALAQRFEVVLACGIGSAPLLAGRQAELALLSSRAGI
jgi:hypothetical protein